MNVEERKQADKPLVWLRGEVKTPPFSADAVVIAEMSFAKKSPKTPRAVIEVSQRRLRDYDKVVGKE